MFVLTSTRSRSPNALQFPCRAIIYHPFSDAPFLITRGAHRGGRERASLRGEALQSNRRGEVDDHAGVRGQRQPEARRLLAEGRHVHRPGLLGLQVIRCSMYSRADR